MKLRCILCVLIGMSLALMIFCATAQTARAADDEPSDFKTIYTKWREVVNDLQAISTKMQTADPVAREKLQKKGLSLIDEGNKLTQKLKVAAEKALTDKSGDTTEIAELLRNIASAALRADEYEEANRLSKLLIENTKADQDTYKVAGMAAYNVNDFARAEKMFAQAGTIDEESASKYFDPLKSGEKEKWDRELKFREKDAAAAKGQENPQVKLTTNKGPITVELFEDQAPNTVANFISLVEAKKYDGTKFHRVLAGFMAQGGDPKGNGTGGPGYSIADESNLPDHRDHFRGSLSMAHAASKDSGGSQFFLTFRPTSHLDGQHTVFGRIIDGMDVLARLNRVEPGDRSGIKPDEIVTATVVRKRDHEYKPKTTAAK